MAAPLQPYPQGTYLQQGNLQVLLTWPASVGATSYSVQRSTDGVTFSVVSSPTALSYLDTSVSQNTEYWYKVAAVNADGTSAYTIPTTESVVPCVAGTTSLLELRRLVLQRADRVNTQFVTVPELNSFINLACDELYDLVTAAYDDYNLTVNPVYFQTNGNQSSYVLPDGVTSFTDYQGNTVVPPPIYKLAGIDLGLTTSANSFVSVQRFNFIDRNKYVFPNTTSTIYGVFGMQYRFIGNSIRFIPQPSANQPIGVWYVPRRTQLLRDTDTTDGFNGWNNYVIVRAAKYVLDKEESNTDKLDSEILYLKGRIEEMTPNRDEGQADTISDDRNAGGYGPNGGGYGGVGGYGW